MVTTLHPPKAATPYEGLRFRGAALRNRMSAQWGEVLTLLETGKRRTKDGRTLVEAWADLVLENPPAAFAFVASSLLPKEPDEQGVNPQLTSIQNLYLTAIQAANRMPEPVVAIEGETSDPQPDEW